MTTTDPLVACIRKKGSFKPRPQISCSELPIGPLRDVDVTPVQCQDASAHHDLVDLPMPREKFSTSNVHGPFDLVAGSEAHAHAGLIFDHFGVDIIDHAYAVTSRCFLLLQLRLV